MKERTPGNGDTLLRLRQLLSEYKGRDSFEAVLGDFSPEGKAQIMRAFDVASLAHAGQKRKEGTDFITHPVGAALIAIYFGERDVNQICKDLLHDSLEDSDYWVSRKKSRSTRIKDGCKKIANEFGTSVADGVGFATKFTAKDVSGKTHGIRKGNATRKTHSTFDKGTPEQQVSKMPDRLHNLLTLTHVGKNRAKRTLKETEEFYIPRWRRASRDLPVYQQMLATIEIAVKDARRALVRVA